MIPILIVALFAGFFYYIYRSPSFTFKFIGPLATSEKKILRHYFPYYNKLNYAHKLQFEKRLNYFLLNKEFIPRDMAAVTEEMKILIGACAVQLTFGFRPLKLVHFNKIMLFPGKYYSSITKKNHKGEVNSNGLIVLSWEDFLKGYKIPDDGLNVGLHEMAHALRIEDLFHDEEYEFIDIDDLQKYYAVSKKEYSKIKKGQKSFLRRYAGRDHDEFFAVCVEQFFEQPAEFNTQLPDLFFALSRVLRQNPLDPNNSIKLI